MLQTTKYQKMDITEALEQGRRCDEDNYIPVIVTGVIAGKDLVNRYWLTDGTAFIPLGYNAFSSKIKLNTLKTKLANVAGKNILLMINGLLANRKEVFIAVDDIALAPERQGALSLYESGLEGTLSVVEEGGLSIVEDD